jgi:hypothetical protein
LITDTIALLQDSQVAIPLPQMTAGRITNLCERSFISHHPKDISKVIDGDNFQISNIFH